MVRLTYLDFIKAIQNSDTINLIGDIDVDLLKLNKIESLNYSFPLIERMILEIYKLVPESDVEHYEQGIMKTPISIIDNNIEVLPENTINITKEEMDKLGVAPIRREGVREGRWAVLDYGDVLVHIFNDETRLFYHLENLWGDESNIVRYKD